MAWRLILILSVPFMVLIGCQSQDSREAQDAVSTKSPAETSRGKPSIPQTRPEDWTMFMHDPHFSGKSPDQTLKPPLKLRWKFKTGGPIHASPIIVDGTVYVGSTDGTLYALDAKRWGVKWTFRSGDAIR
ncbi:MAG: PQQ-binding-like beta-propeller repeat protein, partial [Candidatus Poribacteria bacterium]|nr:PQQ-binding-like beta-propeller repeat protein [Candidatus Poribacteria bacterium]